MRKSQTDRVRRIADFRQAAWLLRDKNLVWSADMDAIRDDLADFLEQAVALGYDNNTTLQYIVQNLIADENDLSIGD